MWLERWLRLGALVIEEDTGFDSHHLHFGSQPSKTPALRDLKPSSAFLVYQVCTNTHLYIIAFIITKLRYILLIPIAVTNYLSLGN